MGSKSSDGHSRGFESIMKYNVQARFEEPNFSLIFILLCEEFLALETSSDMGIFKRQQIEYDCLHQR